ncbi:hypothetical protein [Streptomyces solincola]|uniref:hypothetical protein n=1 Tax=Streptomyces solincola TaxID=2100817 RepID=UPI0011B213F9|nr:hypothetical protein [Streptomyces solincola]
MLDDLRGTSLENPPSVVAAAARAVDLRAEFFGGAQVDRDRPVRVTILLCPGTYRVVDLNRVLAGSNQTERLRVRGHHDACDASGRRSDAAHDDRPQDTVRQGAATSPTPEVRLVPTPDGPRFASPGVLPASGPVRFVNATAQGGEMLLQRLRPGVTAERVRQVLEDGRAAGSVFDGPAYGLGGLSAGHQETLGNRSAPGRYVLMSDAPDIKRGVSQATLGAWRIVHLR